MGLFDNISSIINPVVSLPTEFIGDIFNDIGGDIGFGTDPQTVTQSPLETPEQKIARRKLLQIALSGGFSPGSPTDNVRSTRGLPPGVVTALGSTQPSTRDMRARVDPRRFSGFRTIDDFVPTAIRQDDGSFRSPTPSETEQQRQEFIDSVVGVDGFTFGEDLKLPLGNFDLSPSEQAGQGLLESFIRSTPSGFTNVNRTASNILNNIGVVGAPRELDQASAALQDFLQTDDGFIDSQFQPFKTRTERLIGEAQDRLKRGAAFGGDLFSTSTVEGLSDIGSRGVETLSSELARLTDRERDRRLAAIPIAQSIAGQRENIPLNRLSVSAPFVLDATRGGQQDVLDRITASQTFGGLGRFLENARQEAERNELLRRRSEVFTPLSILSQVSGSNVPFGVPSITTPGTSPLEDFLGLASGIGGALLPFALL